MGGKCIEETAPPNLGAASTPIDWDFEYSLLDEVTGLLYVLNHTLQDTQGVILYNHEEHSDLFQYVTVDNVTYTNVAELVDWDNELEEWSEPVMGLWPFRCSIPEDVCIHRE